MRLALRAPDAVSVERLAAREWRLADGTYGTLTVDDRYKREARPNLGAEIREAVAELVDRVRHERVLLLCSCVAGLRCHSEGLARVVNEQAKQLERADAAAAEAASSAAAAEAAAARRRAGQAERAAAVAAAAAEEARAAAMARREAN